MTETGGKCGQKKGQSEKIAFEGISSKCLCLAQNAVAQMLRDGWLSKPTLFHRQSMRPPPGSASAAAACKWALEAQSQLPWGAETMQSMCRAWPIWRELFLGNDVDNPKNCRADPPCSHQVHRNSGLLCQKTESLTMPPAQLPYEGFSWASAMVSLRI